VSLTFFVSNTANVDIQTSGLQRIFFLSLYDPPILPESLQPITIDEIIFADNIARDSDAMMALTSDMTGVFSIDDYKL